MRSEWTLTGLYRALLEDLKQCQTDFERGMCKAMGEKEIRDKATEIESRRKFTPGEVSVLRTIGY